MDKIKIIKGSQGKSYNLITYFKLVDLDTKFIIYNEEKNSFDLHFAKIKEEKNEIKIEKPSDKEMTTINKLLSNTKNVKFRRLSSKDLHYLIYSGEVNKTMSRKEYNDVMNSNLIKKNEKIGKLTKISREKEELKRELNKLKKEKEKLLWEQVKEESRYITDDKLLSDIEKEIKELELDEFYEKCRVNLIKVLVVNLISLIIIGIVLSGSLLINYGATLLGRELVFQNTYLIDIIEIYGLASLVMLFLQIITLGVYKNFFGKLTMFLSTITIIYAFSQMLNNYVYSFGVMGIFLVATINIIINFSLYLQMQLKLM